MCRVQTEAERTRMTKCCRNATRLMRAAQSRSTLYQRRRQVNICVQCLWLQTALMVTVYARHNASRQQQ